MVQISPTSTNANVTLNADGTTKKFVFRACFIDPFQGAVGAAFANKQGFKTAFIMFDQGNDYVRGLAEAFEEAFTDGGGTIVGKESLHRRRTPTSRPSWPRSPRPSPTSSTCPTTTTSSTW